jgi:hypothetical protein
VGRLLRPDAPLMPNYKYLPVGYHGRASSVRPSGLPVRRPKGQRKPASETVPSFGPSRTLDYELEMGVWIDYQSLGVNDLGRMYFIEPDGTYSVSTRVVEGLEELLRLQKKKDKKRDKVSSKTTKLKKQLCDALKR